VRTYPILMFLLAAYVLSACAGAPRRDAPSVDGAQVVVPGLPADIRWFGESRHDFRARATLLLGDAKAAANDGPINVLVLSGGGAGGAFGAGALVGWSRLGTRPEFHIVTGVSAGALIAPFAFLGSAWDAKLGAAFTRTKFPHLMQRTMLRLLFGPSMYRGTSIYSLVDSYVTSALLNAIAKEARKGRLLVVATTDLDSEQPVFWNLGLIAQQGGERARQLFRDVLVASASIPGVFPPMLIPVEQAGERFDEMHVDGSVMTSLFFIPCRTRSMIYGVGTYTFSSTVQWEPHR
jgi:predicted acylesterase/phospholipase RssA